MQIRINGWCSFFCVVVAVAAAGVASMAIAQQQSTTSPDVNALLEQYKQLREQVEQNPAMLEELKQQLPDGGAGIVDPGEMNVNKALQALGAMGNRSFSLEALKRKHKSNCNQKKFLACSSGYRCAGKSSANMKATLSIRGWHGEKCHVQMHNQDGSTGECLYTKPTLQSVYNLYQGGEVTVNEAMAIAQRVTKECHFKQADGQPVMNK